MLGSTVLPSLQDESQWSVNDFWSCNLDNQLAVQLGESIVDISAALMGNNACVDIPTAS